MKASELRIGNWVYSVTTDSLCKVSMLSATIDVTVYPIALTDDILLKCGFEKHTGISRVFGDYSRYIGSKKYFINIDNHDFNLVSSAGVVLTICKIQYLHQLQNLTFVLTDQELQINL